jgi:hypothetical protein
MPPIATKRHLRVAALGAMGATLLAGPALADAIDGDWCSEDRRRISIAGPEIVTPGGAKMRGDYDRHGFVYVVPAQEAGAGTRVIMRLLSEYRVQIKFGEGAEPQIWQRCPPGIS